jgi:hypothetical protein
VLCPLEDGMPVVVYADDSKKENAKATSLTDEHQHAKLQRMVLVIPGGPPQGSRC